MASATGYGAGSSAGAYSSSGFYSAPSAPSAGGFSTGSSDIFFI